MVGYMEGTFEKWDVVKKSDIDLLVSVEEKNQILRKIGYSIDDEGFLIDDKTKQKIIAEDDLEINTKKDKRVALIAGSHNFVRNIAGFSQHLANEEMLKIVSEK